MNKTGNQQQPVQPMDTEAFANVISMTGQKVTTPVDPVGAEVARALGQFAEEVITLRDLIARMAQQLQDELDVACDVRPDLEALIEECDRVLEGK
ncbi:hypothetical protein [Candidatus Sororendozoicomonas aggregata]|uniref:hypothetical protein n=1 Tax=Candidatus Sororendozoicomonas aggregata TaxID=3073239 RepID=UPI002ED08F76